jgi:hypothetical protein
MSRKSHFQVRYCLGFLFKNNNSCFPSDQEAYLVCEAACYQKDQLCEQISNSLKNKTFSELPEPVSTETPNLIQRLRELSLDKRPYIRLHHGDIPVSWPNATGRKIYLKIESGESRAPVTLPLDQHLDSRFTVSSLWLCYSTADCTSESKWHDHSTSFLLFERERGHKVHLHI